MKTYLAQHILSWSTLTILLCALQPGAQAAPVPVRFTNGTLHGFLELRSAEGHVLASGDLFQVAHGNQVTTRLLFAFKDGSIDDETTVFSQRKSFQLITYHHIQKGTSFPHPIDLLIDARSGEVTIHSTGKDGKEEVKTDKLHLPPDLANGMVSTLLQNIHPEAPETRVSILAATPKPRLVTLSISSRGEDSFSLAGSSRKAIHYEIRIDLGGVAGMVAPMIGKQPPNIQVWIAGGQTPSFLREQGPLYQDGPVTSIALVSPTWSDMPHPTD